MTLTKTVLPAASRLIGESVQRQSGGRPLRLGAGCHRRIGQTAVLGR